jgi:hypothetical protein
MKSSYDASVSKYEAAQHEIRRLSDALQKIQVMHFPVLMLNLQRDIMLLQHLFVPLESRLQSAGPEIIHSQRKSKQQQ